MRGLNLVKLSLLGGVVFLSLLLLLRILPFLRFFLIIGMVGLLVVLLLYYIRGNWKQKQSQKAYLRTTAGQIATHISACEAQKERLKVEQSDIQDSLVELRQKLQRAQELPEAVREKTTALIAGFEQEKQLRITKVHFFEQCTNKLQSLLEQHELLLTLETKKQELERYQEQHYDELASMENLRYEVEQEAVNLETLQDLSTRMQRSSALDDVLHLQQELDKMLHS